MVTSGILAVAFYGFAIGFSCGVIVVATVATRTILGLLSQVQDATRG